MFSAVLKLQGVINELAEVISSHGMERIKDALSLDISLLPIKSLNNISVLDLLKSAFWLREGGLRADQKKLLSAEVDFLVELFVEDREKQGKLADKMKQGMWPLSFLSLVSFYKRKRIPSAGLLKHLRFPRLIVDEKSEQFSVLTPSFDLFKDNILRLFEKRAYLYIESQGYLHRSWGLESILDLFYRIRNGIPFDKLQEKLFIKGTETIADNLSGDVQKIGILKEVIEEEIRVSSGDSNIYWGYALAGRAYRIADILLQYPFSKADVIKLSYRYIGRCAQGILPGDVIQEFGVEIKKGEEGFFTGLLFPEERIKNRASSAVNNQAQKAKVINMADYKKRRRRFRRYFMAVSAVMVFGLPILGTYLINLFFGLEWRMLSDIFWPWLTLQLLSLMFFVLGVDKEIYRQIKRIYDRKRMLHNRSGQKPTKTGSNTRSGSSPISIKDIRKGRITQAHRVGGTGLKNRRIPTLSMLLSGELSSSWLAGAPLALGAAYQMALILWLSVLCHSPPFDTAHSPFSLFAASVMLSAKSQEPRANFACLLALPMISQFQKTHDVIRTTHGGVAAASPVKKNDEDKKRQSAESGGSPVTRESLPFDGFEAYTGVTEKAFLDTYIPIFVSLNYELKRELASTGIVNKERSSSSMVSDDGISYDRHLSYYLSKDFLVRGLRVVGHISSEGYFSHVYRAYDTYRKKIVALKIAKNNRNLNNKMLSQWLKNLHGGKHKNICEIYFLGTIKDNSLGDKEYQVMEYIDGVDFGKVLHSGLAAYISRLDMLNIINQIIRALAFLFAHGVTHGDIYLTRKVKNILLLENSKIKLIDPNINVLNYYSEPAKIQDIGMLSRIVSDMNSQVSLGIDNSGRRKKYSYVRLYESVIKKLKNISPDRYDLAEEIERDLQGIIDKLSPEFFKEKSNIAEIKRIIRGIPIEKPIKEAAIRQLRSRMRRYLLKL